MKCLIPFSNGILRRNSLLGIQQWIPFSWFLLLPGFWQPLQGSEAEQDKLGTTRFFFFPTAFSKDSPINLCNPPQPDLSNCSRLTKKMNTHTKLCSLRGEPPRLTVRKWFCWKSWLQVLLPRQENGWETRIPFPGGTGWGLMRAVSPNELRWWSSVLEGDFPIRSRFLGNHEGNTSGSGGTGDQIQALRALQIQSTQVGSVEGWGVTTAPRWDLQLWVSKITWKIINV